MVSMQKTPHYETSCAAGAPLRMESRLPEDIVGEFKNDARFGLWFVTFHA
jgi:hypothetical protein